MIEWVFKEPDRLPLWSPTAFLWLDLWPRRVLTEDRKGSNWAESQHPPSFVSLCEKTITFLQKFKNISIRRFPLVEEHLFTNAKTTFKHHTYLGNFWNRKSVSCMGSQAGSRRNCFSTSVSRVRLVGGSPWGSCRGYGQTPSYGGKITDIQSITNQITI